MSARTKYREGERERAREITRVMMSDWVCVCVCAVKYMCVCARTHHIASFTSNHHHKSHVAPSLYIFCTCCISLIPFNLLPAPLYLTASAFFLLWYEYCMHISNFGKVCIDHTNATVIITVFTAMAIVVLLLLRRLQLLLLLLLLAGWSALLYPASNLIQCARVHQS